LKEIVKIDEDLCTAKWKDNRIVILMSRCIGSEFGEHQNMVQTGKEFNDVPCQCIADGYNGSGWYHYRPSDLYWSPIKI
jgi:hypothetical protein